MSVGQIRRKRDRAIEARQRLMERARLRQRHAEEEMRARASGIDGERLPRIRDPVPQAPGLAGGNCQTVKLIGSHRTVHAGPRQRSSARRKSSA